MKKLFNLQAALFFMICLTLFNVNCFNSDSDDPAPYGITGKWDVYWEPETTTYEYFSIKQTENNLSGIFYDEDDDDPALTGTISGNSIDFNVDYGSPVVFHVVATLNDAKTSFEGTITVENAGVDYDGVYNVHCDKR